MGGVQELVRSRPEAAHPYAAAVCAGALSVFQSVASDAQLLEALSALLANLAAAPGCLPLMAQTGLPTLVATLQNGMRQDVPAGHSIVLEGTLDLLCSFVSEADPGVHPAARHSNSSHNTCNARAELCMVVYSAPRRAVGCGHRGSAGVVVVQR